MRLTADILTSEFGKIQARFRTISIDHLEDLHKELFEWKHKRIITESFFTQNYGDFRFQIPDEIPDAQSIVIIALPQKMHPLDFLINGKHYQTIIPPTYVYNSVRNTCKEILTKELKKTNHSVVRAILPMKLLAVRSGLGEYGKNNICYVDGMGSFARLEGFYTDHRFPSYDWQEKKVMERCTSCILCQQNCPTHCIPTDRFLIHAEHCLTYFNENKEEFPSWVDRRCHHALVGCMRCQMVCPQNRSVIVSKEQPVIFSEEESAMILNKTPRENISETLSAKLISLDINEYYPLLSRNLSVIKNK
ncbi:MAG TPA: FeS-binding protein [Thermoplasmata archaeon]|nr:MAG TPA: FeS-binding protein [Thermoplasmata archaeon]